MDDNAPKEESRFASLLSKMKSLFIPEEQSTVDDDSEMTQSESETSINDPTTIITIPEDPLSTKNFWDPFNTHIQDKEEYKNKRDQHSSEVDFSYTPLPKTETEDNKHSSRNRSAMPVPSFLREDISESSQISKTIYTESSQAKPSNESSSTTNDKNFEHIDLEKLSKKANQRNVAPISLLEDGKLLPDIDYNILKTEQQKLKDIFTSNNIDCNIDVPTMGYSVFRFELEPKTGTHLKKIDGLRNEIKNSMYARAVRIIAPIPGRKAIAIEVAYRNNNILHLKPLLTAARAIMPISVPLGLNTNNKTIIHNFKDDSIVLISGHVGSGKTNLINSIICSVLCSYSANKVQFIMSDLIDEELSLYNRLPQLLIPVMTDHTSTINALGSIKKEIERRITLMTVSGTKSIDEFNEYQRFNGENTLAHIICIINGYDTMTKRKHERVEEIISSFYSICAKAGIHLILTLEDTYSISPFLKQCSSLKISFVQASKVASNAAIGKPGAEHISFPGDMLVKANNSPLERVHSPLVTYDEKQDICASLFQRHETNNSEIVIDEQLIEKAVNVVFEKGAISSSILMRVLGIDYPTASKLMDKLESKGIIGPFRGSIPREILITEADWNEIKNKLL